MDSSELSALLRDVPRMTDGDESDSVLEELQRAVEAHELILRRQAALIARLRNDLKDVKKDDDDS